MGADESGVMRFVLTLLYALLPVGQHAFAEGNEPFTVVLDPGHGGSNLGAPARFLRGRYEKHYTLPISKKIAALLQRQGVRVLLTRTEDTDVTLRERVDFANRARADLFVSIHLNATPRPGPSGHETFFLSLEATDKASRLLANFENQEPLVVTSRKGNQGARNVVDDILLDLTRNQGHRDAQKLAGLIQSHLEPKHQFKNRGIKQAPFHVLMGAAMPAVVCEVGFINHAKEGPYIISEEGQGHIASGIADGILAFGREVVEMRKKQTPERMIP